VSLDEATGGTTRLRTGQNLNRHSGPFVQARVLTHQRWLQAKSEGKFVCRDGTARCSALSRSGKRGLERAGIPRKNLGEEQDAETLANPCLTNLYRTISELTVFKGGRVDGAMILCLRGRRRRFSWSQAQKFLLSRRREDQLWPETSNPGHFAPLWEGLPQRCTLLVRASSSYVRYDALMRTYSAVKSQVQ